MADAVDLDLHGLVGLRLLDADPRDVATVERQLGPLRRPLSRSPDIVVRFVDRIELGGALTYAGWPECAFSDRELYLLRGRGNVAARTLIPFADVGPGCEIVCERANPSVPLLLAVVNLTMLAKGVLPLHASAFVHQGRGVLVTGWSKGGKSETLLAFVRRGAKYVGDEWVYLTPDGEMLGVPEPMRVWLWQLRQMPDVWQRLPARKRASLSALDAGARLVASAVDDGRVRSSVASRLLPVLQRQLYVQLPPAKLFAPTAIAPRGRLDDVVFVSSHTDPGISVTSLPGPELAARMAASLDEERAPFLAYYRQFRFAFPHRRNHLVEEAADRERVLLEKLLAGRVVPWLRHPYPTRIDALYDEVLPLLG